MKKRELLKMKACSVTEKMIDVAYRDREDRYFLFFRAVVENNILKVSVFPKKWILIGRRSPQFEIYISKAENDFITYELEENAWRTAKIDMLHFCGDRYTVWGKENFEYGNCRKVVNEYL